MQLIDKILGIDKLKSELKAYQSTTTLHLYNQIFPSWKSHKAIAAYNLIDIVNSVVNKLAKTAAKLPIYAYDKNRVDLPETDKLVMFLQSLTYLQKLTLYTWLFLSDECFIYKEKTLGVNGTVEKIHFLNPSFITLVISNDFPQEIVQFIYTEPNTGFGKTLERDEVVFIHGFNPTTDPYQRWRGLPKTDVLCQRLTRMESNMKNSVAQMQNGGVPGVLFVKDLPHTKVSQPVISGIKDSWKGFLSNPANKGAPNIQAGDFGYLPIGSSLVDLASIDLEKVDNKAVCNVWGISDILLNSDSASTESNVKEQVKQMYTNAVMPYTTLVDDALNTQFVSDFGAGFRYLKTDFSDVYELQTTMKDKVDALAAAPVMIPNDVLEALGYDRIEDENMDKPLIKSGYEPIDNFEPLPPIE